MPSCLVQAFLPPVYNSIECLDAPRYDSIAAAPVHTQDHQNRSLGSYRRYSTCSYCTALYSRKIDSNALERFRLSTFTPPKRPNAPRCGSKTVLQPTDIKHARREASLQHFTTSSTRESKRASPHDQPLTLKHEDGRRKREPTFSRPDHRRTQAQRQDAHSTPLHGALDTETPYGTRFEPGREETIPTPENSECRLGITPKRENNASQGRTETDLNVGCCRR